MSVPSERDREMAHELQDNWKRTDTLDAAERFAAARAEGEAKGRREAIEAVCKQQAAPPWYAKDTRLAAIRALAEPAETKE